MPLQASIEKDLLTNFHLIELKSLYIYIEIRIYLDGF